MTTSTRTRLSLELVPIVGSRFQPTGFPDLGAATYERAGVAGEQLLVESVQSMANHLEATTWNPARNEPAEAMSALPHVRVVSPDGEFLTSSRLEAHRLASAYILDGRLAGEPMRETLEARFGLAKGKPLDMREVAKQVFALDPVSLIHGVFFAQKPWPWQPKVARAVTSFVEATDARPAVSGGVKKDSVNNESVEGRGSAEGYGMVPHHRVEYTAASIHLHAVIDEQQLASYGLSAESTELLSALAWWELATLLNDGLRLRTACDLVVADADEGSVPDLPAATTRLASAVENVRSELADPIEVVWDGPGKSRKAASSEPEDD